MRTSTALGIIIVSLTGSLAQAGNFAPIEIVAPIIVPPLASNMWGGMYAGGLVAFSDVTGETDYITGEIASTAFSMTGTGYGGFVGYNIQRNNFVFGGEAAITFGGLVFDNSDFDISYGNIIDLKARAGFSFGNALVYGVVGGSFTTLSEVQGGKLNEFPSAGLAYGAGIDYAVGEHLFVGAEYLMRNLKGTTDDVFPSGSSATGNINSAQLRVGWRF